MAQKTIYAVANGNWDATNNWADASDGSGSTYTNPQNGADTYICDLNGKNITVNVAVSVDQIRTGATIAGGTLVIPDDTAASITVATATTGVYSNYAGTLVTWTGITTASSLTINGDVQYASTSTSGMFAVGTKATLTINGTFTTSSSGYGIVSSGSGAVTVSKVGGTALANTSTGRTISHGSTGALIITGALASSGGGYCMFGGGVATYTITGDVSHTAGGGAAIYANTGTWTITGNVACTSTTANASGIVVGNATVSLDGNLSSSGPGIVLYVTNGTTTWIGSRSLPASTECYFAIAGGTLALASGGGALTLTCSGVFFIRKTAGTLTMTSGANNASIVRQIAAAQVACLGQDISAYITGPTLPAAGDVDDSAADFGYAGTPVTPTFAVPPVAKVEDGYFYGAAGTEYEGTLAGGGYTYGDEDPKEVLTTATGAGTYQSVAAADVQEGVAVGVAPAVGTFTSPAVGKVLDDTSWGAGGVEFTGTYHATLVAEVLDSVSFGAGSGQTGTYHEATVGEVQDGVTFGPVSGYTGTYSPGGTYAEGQADQLATDQGIIAGNADSIIWPVEILGQTGIYKQPDAAGYSALADNYGPAASMSGTLAASKIHDAVYGTLADGSVLVAAGGTYVDPSNADVRKGVSIGVAPRVGTLTGCVDSIGVNQGTTGILAASTFYANGTLSSAGAYNATGVIYGAGSYATEASRNSMTAAAAQIATGYSVTLLGSTTNGSATLEAHTANEVISTAGGNWNVANLSVGNVIQDVAFGLSQTGTGANLLATHTTYLSLEAGRNSKTAGAGQILTGYSVTIAGTTTSGSFDISLYCLIAGITWPDLDEVDGGVNFGPVTGLEYEGTGVNATTAQAAAAAALAAYNTTGVAKEATLGKFAPRLIGTLSGAGTGTEICVYSGTTVTYTVDNDGNITNVAFS